MDPSGEVKAMIFPCVGIIEGFCQGSCRSQDDWDFQILCMFDGQIADIESQSFIGLVGRIVFLVHNDQPETCKGGKK